MFFRWFTQQAALEIFFILGIIIVTWFLTWIVTAVMQHRRIQKFLPEEIQYQIAERDRKIKDLRLEVKKITKERDFMELKLRAIRGSLELKE